MTKHPASIMMLGVVGSDGKAMPPVFFQEGYRLTSEDYIKVLKKEYACKRVCFQLDGAPAHTAKNTQKWLKENVEFWPKDFWPSSPPDLNPLDFSIWAHIERQACKKRHNSTKALKPSITKAWAKMDPTYIKNTCSTFRPRVVAVMEAKGQIVKNIL
ncbi:Putative transposable element [Caligus rogercresseyi]|uniref:Transposable element n=1 Tax=Caligus rogercresseyi TaxID=217165 RepID=A0A7T8GTJ2_CALRO|nr:Putative transposable element [Caligus rogercresseyi]